MNRGMGNWNGREDGKCEMEDLERADEMPIEKHQRESGKCC